MPARGKEKPQKKSGSSVNANEIQKQYVEVVKNRRPSDDSDEEVVEIGENKIKDIFKNYQGNESDLTRITQFFESGDNVDCLICKKKNDNVDRILILSSL